MSYLPFPSPFSIRLGQIVQSRLPSVKQPSLARSARCELAVLTKTLQDLTSAFVSVLYGVSTREEVAADTIIKEIENKLDWIEFQDAMKDAIYPRLLFRADTCEGTSPPALIPELNQCFDETYQRSSTLEDFAASLAEHLGKTQNPAKTHFVSMSPNLQWTIHLAGQKSTCTMLGGNWDAGLAILDAKRLRADSRSAIFRVSDILSFLTRRGMDHLIPPELQKWARNCDEYISFGPIPQSGFIRWVAWQSMYSLPGDSDVFVKAYTLRIYREWVVEREVELNVINRQFESFARELAGSHDEIMPFLRKLLSPPEIWGLRVADAVDHSRFNNVEEISEVSLTKLSKLSI